MINKERWVEIMRAAGFKEKDMHNWHIQFEKMEPAREFRSLLFLT